MISERKTHKQDCTNAFFLLDRTRFNPRTDDIEFTIVLGTSELHHPKVTVAYYAWSLVNNGDVWEALKDARQDVEQIRNRNKAKSKIGEGTR